MAAQLFRLDELAGRKSRAGHEDAKDIFKAIVQVVMDSVEATRDQPWWKELPFDELPDLFGEKTSKRVSALVKNAVEQACGVPGLPICMGPICVADYHLRNQPRPQQGNFFLNSGQPRSNFSLF